MNSQVLIDRELLQDLIDGSGMSEYCTDSVVDEATRLLATPTPIPDAGELERLVTEQVKHAYYERKTITEAVGEIVSALQASAVVVPDIARFEKHAMKSRECLSECDVVLLSSIRRLLAASPAPGDGQ